VKKKFITCTRDCIRRSNLQVHSRKGLQFINRGMGEYLNYSKVISDVYINGDDTK